MLKFVSNYLRLFNQRKMGAVDRFSSVTMTIVDSMITITAIGIICVYFYLRESTFAYYLTLVLSASFLITQMLCNRWLRQKRIAIQTLLLYLYISAAAVTFIIEGSIAKGLLPVLILAIMSVRVSGEILRRLRQARTLAGAHPFDTPAGGPGVYSQ